MNPGQYRLRYGAICGFSLVALLLFSNRHGLRVPVTPEAPNRGQPPAAGPLHDIAESFAPFIFHATDPTGGRQDLITNVDFDGDLIGDNNWENFDRHQLIPTVYYSVLETKTHFFITYHLFHPRDWTRFTLWLNDTHENDGENLQVVVRRLDLRVVLLFTQAHFEGHLYTDSGTRVEDGEHRLRGSFILFDDRGVPGSAGRHVGVFVQAHGHGIFGTQDPMSGVSVLRSGEYQFKNGSGLLMRPALAGESVHEPTQFRSGVVPYRLDSTVLKLWPLLNGGAGVGDGRLFDGECDYRDEWTRLWRLPRYYDADRFSGPLGSDRGISPFALDVEFEPGTLGSLFFHPSHRYLELLTIPDEWSTTYLNYPFGAAIPLPDPISQEPR